MAGLVLGTTKKLSLMVRSDAKHRVSNHARFAPSFETRSLALALLRMRIKDNS
jgi:hypothetical protein